MDPRLVEIIDELLAIVQAGPQDVCIGSPGMTTNMISSRTCVTTQNVCDELPGPVARIVGMKCGACQPLMRRWWPVHSAVALGVFALAVGLSLMRFVRRRARNCSRP
jgi:hypothetical protein